MNLFGDSDYLEKLSLKGDPLEIATDIKHQRT